MSWRAHFARFLSTDPHRLHFAAHSHHPWPDVTFEAHQQAWLDAATRMDDKWAHVFGTVLPEAQRHVVSELGLPVASAGDVTFATNTHELVVRVLSCLSARPRIVTTDSEFHSVERQLRRLEEADAALVTRVAVEPLDSFAERFIAAARSAQPELVFFSQVFFNSGAVVSDVAALVNALPSSALVVIDGYHGFMAVPTDWAPLAARACYLAGGYKYAMAGEGACFLYAPTSIPLRPRNTGWFAAFGALASAAASPGQVPYGLGGARLLGATFDPSGLYRFNAVQRWRTALGLTTEATHAYAHLLQNRFLSHAPAAEVREEQLVVPLTRPARGQFLTFRRLDAQETVRRWHDAGVIVDARDDRLRVGFGVYQAEADVDALCTRLAALRS